MRSEEPDMKFFLGGGGSSSLLTSAGANGEQSHGVRGSGRAESFTTLPAR